MTTPAGSARIEAVDIVRGVAMILMALDHTRDFLGVGANPVDLATTTPALFFTRWITHFCAPTFFLLTGTSAYLSRRGRSDRQLAWHLVTRGAWLILFELTLFRGLALQFKLRLPNHPAAGAVGVGMGDDRALRADISALPRHCGRRPPRPPCSSSS